MNLFRSIRRLFTPLALIVAAALCIAVWKLADVGGSVSVYGGVQVRWGGLK